LIVFTAAQLCTPSTHDAFIRSLRTILNSTKACSELPSASQLRWLTQTVASGATPLHLLRPIFLRLKDLPELHPRVLESLLENADVYPLSPVLRSWESGAGPHLRAEFRKSLKRHLFGCNVLHSLRLRLSLADFGWVSSSLYLAFLISNELSQRHTTDASKTDEYGDIAQQFLRTISFIVLLILCRHFSAIVKCLQGIRDAALL
jgi:general transcription factor 3C protein 4